MDLSLSLYKLDNINATFSLSLAASAAAVLVVVVQKSSGDELYAWQDSNSFRRPE
jgi:hypothetical protein